MADFNQRADDIREQVEALYVGGAAELASDLLDALMRHDPTGTGFGDVLGALSINLASVLGSAVTVNRVDDFTPASQKELERLRSYIKLIRDSADLAETMFDKEKAN